MVGVAGVWQKTDLEDPEPPALGKMQDRNSDFRAFTIVSGDVLVFCYLDVKWAPGSFKLRPQVILRVYKTTWQT